MPFRPEGPPRPWGKVAVVGVGLIGGSLCLSWRRRDLVREVWGVDRSPEVLEEARRRGAVDRATLDLGEGVAGAELVVLATPVETILRIGEEELPRVLSPNALVTDVGSTKGEICRRLSRALAGRGVFIGGHPLAGSEDQGIAAAHPHLFENAVFVLTPSEGTPEGALRDLAALVSTTGAEVVFMDPDLHDRVVAMVSHLPQMVAVALVNAVERASEAIPGLMDMAAGGFRDTTRITSSPPDIWKDILLTNREAALEALALFRENLGRIEEAVRLGNGKAIFEEFSRARETRARLPRRPKGLIPPSFDIGVSVPDRPGIIYQVTGILAREGMNIRDIEILRLREGEGGALRLGFSSEEEREKALSLLSQAGYEVRRR